ncbi:lytic transglycosylase domain-containing protein [Sulfurimonas marina]|uniref:LysM peptidoglycan-binding domain-containing protein n=1 Tax=Sulfurimonas marina TaxID=2590551 RepID=A0A7M1AV06_9BACT|nr:lytic transglycosylase domain-containing protein [Sulfurimonas marina]QOP41267.1 LysM peptidoglycan-binding domain-containing protein [Sulfurimonas marina]
MIKYFLSLLLPIFLYANLTYDVNYDKELNVLNSFDIDGSFLYDPIMNDMKSRTLAKDKHFFKAMENAYLFIPAIKSTLSKYNVPQEFLYLAMAESNFRTKAYSNKRAAGLWQFMPGTAKYFKLHIDEYTDERRDPIKSTEAAAKYLSSLHKRFGKWYLAAIAYNCGGGRLNRAIKDAGTDDLNVLLDEEKKYIPKESRYYIRKIVALSLIGSDEYYLLKSEYEYLLNRANAYSLATIKLSSGESLERISKLLGIPLTELKKLNRHLKYDFVPPYAKGYEIYIPYIKLSEFKQKYQSEPIKNIYKVHKVTKGDNLSYIGKKYGVSYRVIKDFNNLKTSRLRINQKLIIPIPKRSSKQRIDTKHYYIVKKGDSLESISKAHKISIQNIRSQNNISGSLIKIGDRLKLYE